MSRKIIIKYECVCCGQRPDAQFIKPSPLKAATQNVTCENCKSVITFKVSRRLGEGSNAYTLDFIDVAPSDEGLRLFKERAEASGAKAAESVEPEQPTT